MPHFKHDCMDPTCCRYAGSMDDADVYLTKSGDVIIRRGDEGADYSCYSPEMVEFLADYNSPVNQALVLIKSNLGG